MGYNIWHDAVFHHSVKRQIEWNAMFINNNLVYGNLWKVSRIQTKRGAPIQTRNVTRILKTEFWQPAELHYLTNAYVRVNSQPSVDMPRIARHQTHRDL